jgi:hypothetical protein
MNPSVRIDVYVELICPWCLIGKRHLERALAQLATASDRELRVDLQWHTVQLIPQVPREGWPFAEFYARRLGSPEAVRQRQAQVRTAAAQAGVEIDFARIQRFPNTTLSHRLLAFMARRRHRRHQDLGGYRARAGAGSRGRPRMDGHRAIAVRGAGRLGGTAVRLQWAVLLIRRSAARCPDVCHQSLHSGPRSVLTMG